MALKRRIPYIIVALLLIIYLAFFVLCTSSLGASLGSGLASFGIPQVVLSAGSFPVDTVNLTTVIESGETSLLGEFTGLESADFSGSSCYTEIQNWAEAHPEVQVRYTVALPSGAQAENTATALDLT